MVRTSALIALAAVVAAPAGATQEMMPAGAPSASPDALYCLRVEAMTGSRLETVECHTRGYWAEYDVDVDADWAENGVRVIGA